MSGPYDRVVRLPAVLREAADQLDRLNDGRGSVLVLDAFMLSVERQVKEARKCLTNS